MLSLLGIHVLKVGEKAMNGKEHHCNDTVVIDTFA